MNSPPTPPRLPAGIVEATPKSLGWLRRPELDPPNPLDLPGAPCVWERPDGTLQYLRPGETVFLRRGPLPGLTGDRPHTVLFDDLGPVPIVDVSVTVENNLRPKPGPEAGL
jgi:hypothetical protein